MYMYKCLCVNNYLVKIIGCKEKFLEVIFFTPWAEIKGCYLFPDPCIAYCTLVLESVFFIHINGVNTFSL